ncbi:hypothetical protein BGAL_0429g00030 [Botrytis galanthina]|uniref:C2H2-type domain-containing protein n=1 Tax=Botrytis galanthina TaxID=278940 RepID=A0A4S8QMD1_9HELO|nr:hypothetical protein BGAL_0429g00030 [Botrytis galanthina]
MASLSEPSGVTGEVGTIADIAERVRQIFGCCCEIVDETTQKTALAQLARFNLWASNIGVFAARHSSLDYRLPLKGTTELSDAELNEFLDRSPSGIKYLGKALLQNSYSNNFLRKRELKFVADAISTLHQLSLAIRKASNRSSIADFPPLLEGDKKFTLIRQPGHEIPIKAANFQITAVFENFVRKVLVFRWFRPACEVELDSREKAYRDALLDRCVEMITKRRRQLTYFRTHQEKLVHKSVPAPHESSDLLPSDEQPLDKWLSLAAPKVNDESQRSREHFNVTVSETTASEFQVSSFKLAPPSSASSSTISSLADDGSVDGGPIEVPRPPRLEITDKEKTCPYCYLVLPANTFRMRKNARRWKQHLLEDLQPYICLFANCDRPGKSYSSFKDWQIHLNQPHYDSWICPLHSDVGGNLDEEPLIFKRLANFEDHLNNYHSDLDASSKNDLFHRSTQLAVLSQRCFVCSEVLSSLSALQIHMANHLRSMSLLALPWLDDVEEEEALASDQLMSAWNPSDYSDEFELTDLREKILNILKSNFIGTSPEGHYFPEDEYDTLFNKYTIQVALGGDDEDSLLAEYVLNHAKKTFATLLLVFSDYKDLREVMYDMMMKNFMDPFLESQELDRSYLQHALWDESRIDEFKEQRWRFLVPTFDTKIFRYDLNSKQLLPLLTPETLFDFWENHRNPQVNHSDVDATRKTIEETLKQLYGLALTLEAMHSTRDRFIEHSMSKSVSSSPGLPPQKSLPNLEKKNHAKAQGKISRLSDTWSMELVIFEAVLWLLYGYESHNIFLHVNAFSTGDTGTTSYWRQEGKASYSLTEAVTGWTKYIKKHDSERDGAIGDLTKLVEDRLLKTDLPPKTDIYTEDFRANAKDLKEQLGSILAHANRDKRYLFSGAHRTSMPLTQLANTIQGRRTASTCADNIPNESARKQP